MSHDDRRIYFSISGTEVNVWLIQFENRRSPLCEERAELTKKGLSSYDCFCV